MAPSENQPTPPCHVVAMPYPGRGHINPMVNFCIAVAESSSDIVITFVVTEEWLGLIGSVDKPPNMSFATIPNVVPSERVRGDDIYGFAMAVMTKMEEPFERLLDELRLPPPAVIIADAFLPWAAEVGGRRNIPVAGLWTMSASVYTVLYHFDLLVQNGHFPIDLPVNGDAIVDYIPGLSPIRVADLPGLLRDQEKTPVFLKLMPQESKVKYLIFTSVYELEANVIDALKQKLASSIYNFGPATSYFKVKDILNSSTNVHDDGTDNYLKWLDIQQPKSVLYVSLGSFLSVSRAQMDEIAIGLRKSGVRFLLVSRHETSRLQELCGEKGLTVQWCDQLRVLCHPSVGGFWSHCGWNSTKEAILTGVPVLTSPIIMDQLPNAKAIVEDWRTGWRVLEGVFDEENFVKGDEIGELVRRFMDLENEERGEIEKNARELTDACKREFERGGLFWTDIEDFIKSIMPGSTTQ
ncbi:UDP-glucuronosyl and UDP-glucosyl transferase [Handroanthus impetiginosus]|uniref:UDP-glucuronosyl and UDP-glucosyl transferase n=1 Tax=Handroanthus impetiginosus TaxID=429701 RepID=A0A2G9I8W5_9LAMI|nr:UDP-glucuronosyl and UDP-glucosyl transferase [Handroanthus impetiginosus]